MRSKKSERTNGRVVGLERLLQHGNGVLALDERRRALVLRQLEQRRARGALRRLVLVGEQL